jgi:hypothetical protein
MTRSGRKGPRAKTIWAVRFSNTTNHHRFSVSYGDERVTEVGRSLDQALEALLRRAAE